mmetsp:Transcript_17332/g.43113  ORF Transcript_17332/g.43113 Transcript_17332/m.43113 type:complete len:604 (+) Transcript_17332:847-2658(+)
MSLIFCWCCCVSSWTIFTASSFASFSCLVICADIVSSFCFDSTEISPSPRSLSCSCPSRVATSAAFCCTARSSSAFSVRSSVRSRSKFVVCSLDARHSDCSRCKSSRSRATLLLLRSSTDTILASRDCTRCRDISSCAARSVASASFACRFSRTACSCFAVSPPRSSRFRLFDSSSSSRSCRVASRFCPSAFSFSRASSISPLSRSRSRMKVRCSSSIRSDWAFMRPSFSSRNSFSRCPSCSSCAAWRVPRSAETSSSACAFAASSCVCRAAARDANSSCSSFTSSACCCRSVSTSTLAPELVSSSRFCSAAQSSRSRPAASLSASSAETADALSTSSRSTRVSSFPFLSSTSSRLFSSSALRSSHFISLSSHLFFSIAKLSRRRSTVSCASLDVMLDSDLYLANSRSFSASRSSPSCSWFSSFATCFSSSSFIFASPSRSASSRASLAEAPSRSRSRSATTRSRSSPVSLRRVSVSTRSAWTRACSSLNDATVEVLSSRLCCSSRARADSPSSLAWSSAELSRCAACRPCTFCSMLFFSCSHLSAFAPKSPARLALTSSSTFLCSVRSRSSERSKASFCSAQRTRSSSSSSVRLVTRSVQCA